jgi:glutamate/tyrosine decarboxylase-like PLP-dependent enzyme
VADRPDPVNDLDWSSARARALGEDVVGLWAELVERLPDLGVNRDFDPAAVRDALELSVPEEGLERPELVERLRALAFEQSMYPGHPGFLGYISGAGTVPGAAAELLASGLNQNLGGFRLSPGASEVEAALTRWLAAQFGLPDGSGGQLLTGGAMANFVGLKAARDRAVGAGVRERGIRDAPPLAIYASTEAHVVQHRAADMLGLGSDAVRPVGVDSEWRMRPDALAAAVEADLAEGVRPAAVVATAGTTATGAIDPLPELAKLCERHKIWLHVDAAYGGPAVLADDLRPLLAGIELADSIAVDPHKWLYTPLPAGCLLVRDLEGLAESFASEASYTWMDEHLRQGIEYRHLGPNFSRGFTALSVWVSLLAHGRAAYGRRISHDAALAHYLAELVVEAPDFELMAPVGLSVTCFRYAPEQLRGDEEGLDRLNQEVMTAIQADGRVYCSNAVLNGAFCLRSCVVNFRTEAEHMETLLSVAREHGERRLEAAAPG